MDIPLYATKLIFITATQLLSNKSKVPYTGSVNVWVWPPNATDPTVESVALNSSGQGQYGIYCDLPDTWRYCVRIVGSVKGATPDREFNVVASDFPEA